MNKLQPSVIVIKNMLSRAPKCGSCVHSFKQNNELVCKLYKYAFISANKGKSVFDYYLDTKTCRADTTLCGPTGIYFLQK
jgi:hypothetical protein